MLTPDRESAIRDLVDQATPIPTGQNRYHVESIRGGYRLNSGTDPVVRGAGGFRRRQDAEFAAQAPGIVRELLAEADDLRSLACALARHLDNTPCPACPGGCGEHSEGCGVRDLLEEAAALAASFEGVGA